MVNSRRGDAHRINAGVDQFIHSCEWPAAPLLHNGVPVRLVHIDHAHQFRIGHLRVQSRMMTTHPANADHAASKFFADGCHEQEPQMNADKRDE
jgi:hypothetical protein